MEDDWDDWFSSGSASSVLEDEASIIDLEDEASINDHDLGDSVLTTFLQKCPKIQKVMQSELDKNNKPYKGTEILLIHHLTREVLGLVEAFRKLGCSKIYIAFTSYNPDAKRVYIPIFDELEEVNVFTLKQTSPGKFKPDDVDDFQELNNVSENTFINTVRTIAAFITIEMSKSQQKKIIVEDGGYIAPVINKAIFQSQMLIEFCNENGFAMNEQEKDGNKKK